VACVILNAFGLFGSFSRGAWLGVIIAILLFGPKLCVFLDPTIKYPLKINLRSNLIVSGVAVCSIVILLYWFVYQQDWHLLRRVVSVVNQNDFSWRNRVFAWVGDLQMMAERPWFGFGWEKPELMYGCYFLPSKMAEIAAIEMNDYLMLGASIGIPALFCFCMYLWQSFFERTSRGVVHSQDKGLKIICQAGAFVLAVGFWFDGGLFKLATASTFWILLELGNVDYRAARETSQNG
jgi:O-antigen ligase